MGWNPYITKELIEERAKARLVMDTIRQAAAEICERFNVPPHVIGRE